MENRNGRVKRAILECGKIVGWEWIKKSKDGIVPLKNQSPKEVSKRKVEEKAEIEQVVFQPKIIRRKRVAELLFPYVHPLLTEFLEVRS